MTEQDQPGFSLHPDVLSSVEVGSVLAALTDPGLPRTRAGRRHLFAHPAVSALAREPRLLTLANAELGRDAFPFRATLFDKSADANWLVVWHQDTALPLRERRDKTGWGPWSVKAGVHYAHAPREALEMVVALRIHLDDSTSDNGPLRVLPGTHRLGVLSDAQIRELAQAITPVECLAVKGGVVRMRPLLVHSSSKCAVAAPRRVLHVEYSASRTLPPGLELADA
jgi:ectoine hydroxylase-related dioxygenase (phytanoyl-CoA dioxygenase family)